MPKSTYEPLRGWLDLHDRALAEVVTPWLSLRRNAVLSYAQAEALTRIVTKPEQIKLPFVTSILHPAADALASHPLIASKLLRAVGEWTQRQRKTQRGRVMMVLDELCRLGRSNDLTIEEVRLAAKREKIDLRDVSPTYIRNRVGEMRKMIREQPTAPKLTHEQIDAHLESIAQNNAGK